MRPNWTRTFSMSGSGEHLVGYVDDDLGVEMAVLTPMNRASDSFGKSRMRYAIRGSNKVFVTEDDLIDELERNAKGGLLMVDRCPSCGFDLR